MTARTHLPASGRTDTASRIAVMVAGFCSMLNLYAPQPILPLLAQEFHASPVVTALTIGTTALAVACVAPFAGFLSDMKGRKPIIVGAMFALVVPTLLSAFADDLHGLLVTRFLQGLCIPAIFVATLAYVTEEWPSGRRGRITAIYVTANVLGGFCGRLIGGFAASMGNWHMLFVIMGLINLVGGLAIWRMMAPSRRFTPHSNIRGGLGSLAGNLRSARLVSAFVVGFCILFSLVALFTYIPFRMAEPPFELAPLVTAAMFASYLIGASVTPYSGRWIDGYGHRRVMLIAMPVALCALGAVLLPSLPMVFVGLAVFCGAMFIAQAASTSFVAREAAATRSSAVGLYLTCYYVGGAVGAVLPGLAYGQAGWVACVVLVAVMLAGATVVVHRLWNGSAV